jgi:hypothetical protein
MRALPFAFALALVCTANASAQDRATSPRYLEAIEAELEVLRVAHACEATTPTRARCSWTHRGRTSNRELNVHLVYSDETDTIYFYVARYLSAPPEVESTTTLLRRLMELNWQLLIAKFEWDPNGGEVRLAMAMNTDSNFDRRAFRSIVRQIGTLADRYSGELTRIVAPTGSPE